ncbi:MULTISPECIES: glycosyl hydrolase family 28-related protein [unclassified Thiocapsa]|uniref:glycosyl hydrolase family 28-related protein n=1 Tax=unclassified Thiocapsa TaxID=2641286 RepID=UPI0035B47CE7
MKSILDPSKSAEGAEMRGQQKRTWDTSRPDLLANTLPSPENRALPGRNPMQVSSLRRRGGRADQTVRPSTFLNGFLLFTTVLLAALAHSVVNVSAADLPQMNSEERRMASSGFLPVTAFGAIPDDDNDDTLSIQKAIETARDRGFVAFFPPGTYLVSDTLNAVQPVEPHPAGRGWTQDRRRANALQGSPRGQRAILKLADAATGFSEASNPKPLVRIWAQPRDTTNAGSKDPRHEQPNISFNQVFKGIDIDLRREANQGAVGIQHTGSQGSTIEDVTVFAEGAFAGVLNPPGQGGGVYNLTVIGGAYGVWADHRSRYPIIAGVRLLNQRISALYWKGQSNITIAGFLIEASGPGPAVALQKRNRPHNGTLTLVDGRVKTNGKRAFDNHGARSVYLRNVYVTGAAEIIQSGDRPPISGGSDSSSSVLVEEYIFACDECATLINGVTTYGPYEQAKTSRDAVPGSDEAIFRKHVWGPDFPSFQDPETIKVTDFGAVPDDGNDDTDAFKAALGSSQKVLVPPGVFQVSDTLTLGPHQHLMGAAKNLSIIAASREWKAESDSPLLATSADSSATASLSSLLLENTSHRPLTLLHWQAGPASIVRGIMAAQTAYETKGLQPSEPTFLVSGAGAGRWYGLAAEWNRMKNGTRNPQYRHLLVKNSTAGLSFYGLNIERSHSSLQSEIRNSANVNIYYMKAEISEPYQGQSSVLGINDSEAVHLFGFSGNAKPLGHALIRVHSSNDVLAANVAPVAPDAGFWSVSETFENTAVNIPGSKVVTLFRREADSKDDPPATESEFKGPPPRH